MKLGGLSYGFRLGGAKPLPAWWLKTLQAAYGSAFSKDLTSNIGIKQIAMSRCLAAVGYVQEKVINNSIPSKADDALALWAQRLGITVLPTSTKAEIRAACAAKYAAVNGPTVDAVNLAVSTLLGSVFVRIDHYYGDDPTKLSHEAPGTFWDAGTPAPGHSFDFAGDTFLSPTSFILVRVQQPATMSNNDFFYLVNVRLKDLLDDFLPAWTRWSWSFNTDGFYCDISPLDYTSIS